MDNQSPEDQTDNSRQTYTTDDAGSQLALKPPQPERRPHVTTRQLGQDQPGLDISKAVQAESNGAIQIPAPIGVLADALTGSGEQSETGG